MKHFRRFTIAALVTAMGLAAGFAVGAPVKAKPAAGGPAAQTMKLPAGHVSIKGKGIKDCQPCHVTGEGKAGSLRGHITGAQMHALNGVGCADCHDDVKHPQPVATWKCVSCHGPTKDLAARTANVQPTNPHQSRHYGTDADCSKCHHEHRKSENDCGACHKFNFQVP